MNKITINSRKKIEDESIRIAFVITGLSTGGAETMLLKLLQNIDRRRFNLLVISLLDRGTVGSKIEALDIPVISLNMRRSGPNLFLFFKLAKLLKYFSPDIIHTWMYHADLLGGLAGRIAGCKKIIWCIRNSNLDANLIGRSTVTVVKICAFLSTWLPVSIVSCSNRAMEIHAKFGYAENKFQVIPNGFELLRYTPNESAYRQVRVELGIPSGAALVGLIARYDPQKNQEGFLAAASTVHQLLPNVHFLMAGKDVVAENSILADKIHELGLEKNVHLLGHRDDTPRLMASLDVLASSSLGEAFPNVLGEAMACGVPCVVTDVGDSAEIVGSLGRVVKSGDMLSLAMECIALLSLPDSERSALKQQVRIRICEKYDISHIVRLYQQAYITAFAIDNKGDC